LEFGIWNLEFGIFRWKKHGGVAYEQKIVSVSKVGKNPKNKLRGFWY
jgi:hypothetical protein